MFFRDRVISDLVGFQYSGTPADQVDVVVITHCHPDHIGGVAEVLGRFIREGWVNLVGGCCGTTPAHVRAIAEAVEGVPPREVPRRAALRAAELGCALLLKGTKVDGVYDKDPAAHADAVRFEALSVDEMIDRKLRVMDLTAATLCRAGVCGSCAHDGWLVCRDGPVKDVSRT